MTRPAQDLPIAIVGAGFSGTVAALHLLARTRRPILLCERAERFARGAAYGALDPGHLLNVRASNMSAFPDQPDHFVRWLDGSGHAGSPLVHQTPAGTFVSRHLYGCYLTSLLGDAVSASEGASRLILVPDEVLDLAPEGDGYRLVLAGGRQPAVAAVVLAVGNLIAAPSGAGAYVANPWEGDLAAGLEPADAVVVIGSGLSMVDVALQLRHAGLRGPITALSRHGLLPHSHAASGSWPTPVLEAAERASPARLLRRLRREAAAAARQGVPWQGVVDSIRPITATLWNELGRAAQRRFLRHARAFWDIHRHRLAVPVGAAVADLLRDGSLRVQAGHVLAVDTDRDRARVTYRPRGSTARVTLHARRVISAMGPVGPARCTDTLVRSLMDRGLARCDELQLGLDLSAGCELIGTDRRPVPRLWAIGPLGRGVFWECTAVPDIRQQVAQLAERIATDLAA